MDWQRPTHRDSASLLSPAGKLVCCLLKFVACLILPVPFASLVDCHCQNFITQIFNTCGVALLPPAPRLTLLLGAFALACVHAYAASHVVMVDAFEAAFSHWRFSFKNEPRSQHAPVRYSTPALRVRDI